MGKVCLQTAGGKEILCCSSHVINGLVLLKLSCLSTLSLLDSGVVSTNQMCLGTNFPKLREQISRYPGAKLKYHAGSQARWKLPAPHNLSKQVSPGSHLPCLRLVTTALFYS